MLLLKTIGKAIAFSFLCSFLAIATVAPWQSALVGLIWIAGLIWIVANAVKEREARTATEAN